MQDKTFLKEIFTSIQGEGLFVGQKQIFIRFCDCNLSCSYCDTDFTRSKYCNVFSLENYNDNRADSTQILNPVSVGQLLKIISGFDKTIETIAITGGEPLLSSDFLMLSLPVIKKETRHKILLETNATLPEPFAKISKYVDILSFDIKLPSVGSHKSLWPDYEKFIRYIPKKVLSYCKIVVNKDVSCQDLLQTAKLLKGLSGIIIFIQPEINSFLEKTISLEKLDLIRKDLLSKLPSLDIRILPQLHKLIKIY